MCNWIHSLCFHLLKNVLFYWLYNLLYSSCSKSQNNLLSSTVAKNVSRSAHCLCAVCPVLKGGFFWFLFWSLCFKCWDFHRELHFKSRSINRTVLFFLSKNIFNILIHFFLSSQPVPRLAEDILLFASLLLSPPSEYRIKEWFGLEKTLQIICFQIPCPD